MTSHQLRARPGRVKSPLPTSGALWTTLIFKHISISTTDVNRFVSHRLRSNSHNNVVLCLFLTTWPQRKNKVRVLRISGCKIEYRDKLDSLQFR